MASPNQPAKVSSPVNQNQGYSKQPQGANQNPYGYNQGFQVSVDITSNQPNYNNAYNQGYQPQPNYQPPPYQPQPYPQQNQGFQPVPPGQYRPAPPPPQPIPTGQVIVNMPAYVTTAHRNYSTI